MPGGAERFAVDFDLGVLGARPRRLAVVDFFVERAAVLRFVVDFFDVAATVLTTLVDISHTKRQFSRE